MATGLDEAVRETKGQQPEKRRRRLSPTQTDDAKPRFFLAKQDKNNREPGFERELASEAEALVESLKTGRSFYAVYEYRAAADCSGKSPQIRKEAV